MSFMSTLRIIKLHLAISRDVYLFWDAGMLSRSWKFWLRKEFQWSIWFRAYKPCSRYDWLLDRLWHCHIAFWFNITCSRYMHNSCPGWIGKTVRDWKQNRTRIWMLEAPHQHMISFPISSAIDVLRSGDEIVPAFASPSIWNQRGEEVPPAYRLDGGWLEEGTVRKSSSTGGALTSLPSNCRSDS